MNFIPIQYDRIGTSSVFDALVVAARRQRMVTQHLEMRAQALEHGCEDKGRISLRVLSEMPGSCAERSVQNADLVGVAFREIFNAVGQRTAGVFALEDEHADAGLNQFERTVEEIGRMYGTRADPLHLLQDAHSVIVRLRPD